MSERRFAPPCRHRSRDHLRRPSSGARTHLRKPKGLRQRPPFGAPRRLSVPTMMAHEGAVWEWIITCCEFARCRNRALPRPVIGAKARRLEITSFARCKCMPPFAGDHNYALLLMAFSVAAWSPLSEFAGRVFGCVGGGTCGRVGLSLSLSLSLPHTLSLSLSGYPTSPPCGLHLCQGRYWTKSAAKRHHGCTSQEFQVRRERPPYRGNSWQKLDLRKTGLPVEQYPLCRIAARCPTLVLGHRNDRQAPSLLLAEARARGPAPRLSPPGSRQHLHSRMAATASHAPPTSLSAAAATSSAEESRQARA